jgi:hypothetical protein
VGRVRKLLLLERLLLDLTQASLQQRFVPADNKGNGRKEKNHDTEVRANYGR